MLPRTSLTASSLPQHPDQEGAVGARDPSQALQIHWAAPATQEAVVPRAVLHRAAHPNGSAYLGQIAKNASLSFILLIIRHTHDLPPPQIIVFKTWDGYFFPSDHMAWVFWPTKIPGGDIVWKSILLFLLKIHRITRNTLTLWLNGRTSNAQVHKEFGNTILLGLQRNKKLCFFVSQKDSNDFSIYSVYSHCEHTNPYPNRFFLF